MSEQPLEQAPDQPTAGLIVTGEVTVGFPAQRTGYGAATYGNTQPQTQTATWLIVHSEGNVTAFAGKVEYGQGIRWGLSVEVADELRLPLDRVEMVLGDTGRVPWDIGTFGSQSTARVGLQLRKAAATARRKLLELATDRLDLPASDLRCSDGKVVASGDAAGGVEYAELLGDERIEVALVDDIELRRSPSSPSWAKRRGASTPSRG
ncbi:MAG: molybdopterin-dependent oxidoreductase [Dehalococcoidia bacterium]|nr:molybdopterin-dependent oxidoreductase [Dehalococcoidia bacterium]